MRLWLLRPVTGWKPWYDSAFGFVVRAETEERARHIASTEAGDEGSVVWFDPAKTTCVELQAAGPEEIVLRDFAAA